jgi:hypothetical protein
LKCCPKNGDVPKLPLSENGSTGADRQARKYLNIGLHRAGAIGSRIPRA